MQQSCCNYRKLRLRRFFNQISGRLMFIPLDHGVTMGPIHGLADIRKTITDCLRDSVNGLILHKGSFMQGRGVLDRNQNVNLIMHLSASVLLSPDVNNKVMIGNVEEAIRLGADAVSVHVNLGVQNDREMLEGLGRISGDCNLWGMPLLAMMYSKRNTQTNMDIAISARVAMEMGADIVKINYSGDKESFSNLCSTIGIPVIVAGGEQKNTDREFFQEIYDALDAGASGIAAGRNVFQHRNPGILIDALDLMINHRGTVNECCEFLENNINECTVIGVKVNDTIEAVMV